MEKHKLDITIFCAGMEVNPETLKEKSLGGSETAGISMAHELAKLGHHVLLFCNTKESKKYKGVQYLPMQNFQAYATSCPHDVLIGQRIPEVFRAKLQSKINILWQHDVALKQQRKEFHGSLWNLDKVFCLSDWQIQQYKDIYQINCDDLFYKTRNGINLIAQPDNSKRQPKRLVYTNRPERGMDNLLFNIMPKLWEKDPEIELCLAGYDNTHPNMEQFYNSCYAKIAEYQQQGRKIAHLGALNKNELYELYKTATLYVYPTAFHETSCITAMESQMCGIPMITSHIGALPETLCNEGNILVFGDYKNEPEYNDVFVEQTLNLLNNPKEIEEMQKKCFEKAKQYRWDEMAKEWENLFMEIFHEKTMNKNRLCRHLLEREDIMALKQVARADLNGYTEVLKNYSYIESKHDYRAKYIELGQEYVEVEQNIELRNYARTNLALEDFKTLNKKDKPRILDFASGICNESIQLANLFDAEVDSVNISDAETELGEKMIEKYLKKGEVNQIIGHDVDCLNGHYDMAFFGEILEHQPNPDKFIKQFDKVFKKDTIVVITVPFGLWEDRRYAHLWNYERYDLAEMFKDKKDLQIKMVSGGINMDKQQQLGWWVVTYIHDNKPVYPVDIKRKLVIQNPRETVSVCMIVKNEENMLHRCLKSIRPIADELIINDTGSTDSTLEIAKQYGAKIINGKSPLEIGFDKARNESIKHAKSDWVLWLDADEELLDTNHIYKYLRPNIFAGYSIRQHHFAVDAGETKIDTPIRLFRNNRSIVFYGFVHEHPEVEGQMNDGVGISTLLGDVNIAHDGYFSENRRRGRFARNINLMFKEFELHPNRLLTRFLMLRDYCHIARYEKEQNQNQLTPKAIECLEKAIEIYKDSFLEKPSNYNAEALLFYSEALMQLGKGLEYRFNINIGQHQIQPDAQDTVCRFETSEDFMKYLKNIIEEKKEPYTGIFI